MSPIGCRSHARSTSRFLIFRTRRSGPTSAMSRRGRSGGSTLFTLLSATVTTGTDTRDYSGSLRPSTLAHIRTTRIFRRSCGELVMRRQPIFAGVETRSGGRSTSSDVTSLSRQRRLPNKRVQPTSGVVYRMEYHGQRARLTRHNVGRLCLPHNRTVA